MSELYLLIFSFLMRKKTFNFNYDIYLCTNDKEEPSFLILQVVCFPIVPGLPQVVTTLSFQKRNPRIVVQWWYDPWIYKCFCLSQTTFHRLVIFFLPSFFPSYLPSSLPPSLPLISLDFSLISLYISGMQRKAAAFKL